MIKNFLAGNNLSEIVKLVSDKKTFYREKLVYISQREGETRSESIWHSHCTELP